MGLELQGSRLVPLADAGSLIRALLPVLALPAQSSRVFNPDAILSAAKAAGATVEMTPVPDWEPLPDAEVYRLLARGWLPGGPDPVVVVPADSLRSGRLLSGHAVECPQNLLPVMIASYLDRAESHFFDGDTIFVCPAQRAMLIFHHEGYGFVVRGIPKVP